MNKVQSNRLIFKILKRNERIYTFVTDFNYLAANLKIFLKKIQ